MNFGRVSGWFGRGFVRSVQALCVSGCVATLVACGGAGAGAGGAGSDLFVASQPSQLTLTADAPRLPTSDGSTSTVVTALVKDSSNNAVANQKVNLLSSDTGLTIAREGSATVTDSSGRMKFRVTLESTSGVSRSRTASLEGKLGSVSGKLDLPISGATLSIAGPESLASGATGDYTVTLLDSAGKAASGVAVALTTTSGSVSPASITTSTTGQGNFRLTAAVSGAATVSATATGLDPVTRTVQFVGSDTPFRIIVPADNATVDINTTQRVQVELRNNGAAVVAAPITLTTTRGLFSGQSSVSGVTDASGRFAADLSSSGVGQANLTALSGSSTTTSRINFVSRTPAKLSLSTDVSSLPVNTAGASSSSTRLVATVRDANDNVVTGATVIFSAIADPSGGSIQPGTAITDSSGQAVANFVAGPTSTGPGAVRLNAQVVSGSGTLSADTPRTLTVTAAALFLELGTGNSIASPSETVYSMPWSVVVTDANRNPVANARVTASLKAVAYRKGVWQFNATTWTTAIAGTCGSEDLNQNNLLDAGEDLNGNSKLDPGSPAAVQVTSTNGTTGSDGLAALAITYPKSFGEWVQVVLQVTIASSGTESVVSRQFVLPAAASDLDDPTVAPPNVGTRSPSNQYTGPYGYVANCASPD